MSNLLSRGQKMLARHLQTAAAPATENGLSMVTYWPVVGGPAIDLSGRAWVGRTVFSRVNQEGGASTVFGERDLLCPVNELKSAGVAEPMRGDRVAEVINGVEVVFEVIEPLGEPSHRYADPGRTIWRIHLKEVAA